MSSFTLHKRFGYEEARLFIYQEDEQDSLEVTEIERHLMEGTEQELATLAGKMRDNKVMYVFTHKSEPNMVYAMMFWDFTCRYVKWYPKDWGDEVPSNLAVKDDNGKLVRPQASELGLRSE